MCVEFFDNTNSNSHKSLENKIKNIPKAKKHQHK